MFFLWLDASVPLQTKKVWSGDASQLKFSVKTLNKGRICKDMSHYTQGGRNMSCGEFTPVVRARVCVSVCAIVNHNIFNDDCWTKIMDVMVWYELDTVSWPLIDCGHAWRESLLLTGERVVGLCCCCLGLIPGIRNRWRALIGGPNSQAVISCPLSLTLEPQFHICAMTGFGVGARAGGVHNGPNSVRFNEIYSQRREDHWVCDEQRPPDLAES